MKVVMIAMLAFSALNLMRLAYTHDSRLRVPPALGFVMGVTLLFAAVVVGLRLLGREAKEWVVLPILLGMTAMCAWVAIWGNAGCRSRSPLILPRISCRAGFGFGAVLLLLMVGMFVYGWWRRVRAAAESAPESEARADVATNAP